jgi:hypothetical protein
MTTHYHIYMGDHSGGPINYAAPIGTAAGTTFSPPALPAGSRTRFGIRAFDTATGMEEKNTDATIEIVIAADGSDVSAIPGDCVGVEARAAGAGNVRVAWSYLAVPGMPAPTAFHVYANPGAIDWTLPPVVSVTASPTRQYVTFLSGMADGVAYAVGVRSVAAGVESPGVAVPVVGISAGILDVSGGVAAPTNAGD